MSREVSQNLLLESSNLPPKLLKGRSRCNTQFTSAVILNKLRLIALTLMIGSASAVQVSLRSGQVSLANASVSQNTVATLEIFRLTSGATWQTNQCFQLYVASPYSQSTFYSTFVPTNQPICSTLNPDYQVNCFIQNGATDTLSFYFTQIGTTSQTGQALGINLTNFNTPFSSQIIGTVNIRSYSDQNCQNNMVTVAAPGLTIQQATLPQNQVFLSSSNNTLGTTLSSNTLNITFKPATTMSPSLSGQIQLSIPNWYTVGTTSVPMYNPTAFNKCSSQVMFITSSILDTSGNLLIKYINMNSTFVQGKYITVLCRQFYNPIRPEIWYNFVLTTFDDQASTRIIEQSNSNTSSSNINPNTATVFFDARTYLPAIIPVQNFQIDPTNYMVSTFSKWTITLNVNIPLEDTCWIRIYVPQDFTYKIQTMSASGIFIKPDEDPTLQTSDINVIYRNPADPNSKSSLLLQGCNVASSLGQTPFGRLVIDQIQTQDSMRDSNTFDVSIFRDRQCTQLIAVLAYGAIVSGANLVPGNVTNIFMFPQDLRVQRNTSITVSFQTSHQIKPNGQCQITLPQGLNPGAIGSVLTVSSQDNSTQATKGIVQTGNIISISGFTGSTQILPANSTITLTISGITNQLSAKDAGNFQVTTLNLFQGKYDIVDQQTSPLSFTAIPGQILPSGTIGYANATNFLNDNTYTFSFTTQDFIPSSGYITVTLPQSIILDQSTAQSSASCKSYTCTNINSTSVTFLISQNISSGQPMQLSIGGIANPRSFQPTSPFILTSLDTDGVSFIDQGYNLPGVMTIPGPITSFSVVQSNFTNGAINTYTFSVQAQIPVQQGDQLTFVLPKECGAPKDAATMNCTALSNLISMTCSISESKVTIVFNNFTLGSGAFTWTISGIQNPGSTQPSTPFSNVLFLDNLGYIVSSYTGTTSLTNKYAANLQIYSLSQGSLVPSDVTDYNISFNTVNSLPSTGSFQINYPASITLLDGDLTVCSVTTSVGVFPNSCTIHAQTTTITVQNIFASIPSYYGNITVSLKRVKNAINNKQQDGFKIRTYWDQYLTYQSDILADYALYPQFPCIYPCQNCNPGQPAICTACWQTPADPNFLMNYPNQTSTCRPTCDQGYTTNGNINKICVACDQSCGSCYDNGKVGDIYNCIQCSPNYPFRLSQTNFCQQQCTLGQFQSTNASCSLCKSPCQGCFGSETNCTSCDGTSKIPNLFINQCIDLCPQGYISINGICSKCESPCSTCVTNTTYCTSCDGSGGTKFIYNQKCYADCPPGSGPDSTSLTCFTCNEGCDLCDINNKTLCLKCTPPTLSFNGSCVPSCPDGWHVNSDNTACRPWQLSDLGTLPYPFLIAAGIFTIICLFGLLKRRAYLSHGKMAMYSPQNTLTCIIIALAPLQFLATITQWILSYFYGTVTFAILALAVTVAALIVNIVFQVWFSKHFNSKMIPLEIERKVRLFKMTKVESQKHMVDRDDKFISYKRQNRCAAYTIFSLTATMSFKFNKAYYSFFYDLKVFQAQFTQAKYYRKMMTWYQIIYLICIDLALICIDVTGLTKIESGNQLYITMQETLILSLLSIILGSFELWKLKDILKYTEPPKDKQIKLNKGADSDSEENDEHDLDKKFDKEKMKSRREMMGNLLKQVKHNKQLFLNNKLDDLLTQFGDRKCKSMLDLGTGWQLEDDPRLVITWPISPMLRDDYGEMDLKFGKEDAYGAQGNNVYADAKSKYMGMDFGTQDDAGYLEFQDALNRKAGGLMSQQEGDLEERRQKQRNRRRGRKNKYYAQIDHEDDQEADQLEASDREGDLQIIKEQEEEEENMRKTVAAQAAKQQEAALLRKKQQEEDKQQKLAQEQAEAEARRLKALEIEKAAKQEQLAAIERAAKAAKLSKSLEEEAAQEKAKREAEEKKRAEDAAKASAIAREEYEKAELLRLAQLKKDQEKKQAEADAELKRQLENQKNEKQRAIDEALRLQAEKDAKELLEKQKRQQEEDALRAAEKERLRLEKEAAQRLQAEKEAAERAEKQRIADELEALEKLKKEQQRAEEKERKEQARLEKERLKQLENEKLQLQKVSSSPPPPVGKAEISPRKDNYSEMNQSMNMADTLLQDFQNLSKPMDIPPKADLRTFNVHDILGEHDRDDKGNIVVNKDQNGVNRDKQGNITNERGYLIDQSTGAVVENQSFAQMFASDEMDERDEVPAPFCVEKYNFNPHQLMGDFDYIDGKPQLMQTNKGYFMDKKSRRVNKFGWMTLAGQGHLVDANGRKKFDKSQLTKEGDLHKLFNYQGKRFDIKDVMGIFEKDILYRIVPQQTNNGLVDNLGRSVNEKGYLIDSKGNIIDVNGRQLWRKEDLKNGEFPKIFPFTKFNITRVTGDFEMNPSGNPILTKSPSGKGLVDSRGRFVNERGYLIDGEGNVIDIRGKRMFDKIVLESDGEIPQVFRTGMLKSETGSELSRLMSEIEKNQPFDGDRNEDTQFVNDDFVKKKEDGETSLDSQMEDTPANYNQANQRFDERADKFGSEEAIPEDDEGGEHFGIRSEYDEDVDGQVPLKKIKKKPKKKKAKLSTVELLQPTGREKNMAGAYGGQAIGSIRRPGIKYDKERLEGSMKFRVSTADEPKVRETLTKLVKSTSGMHQLQSGVKSNSGNGQEIIPHAKLQGLMGVTGFDSQENRSQRSALRKQSRADSRSQQQKKSKTGIKPQKRGMQEGDFEQMFGKDIDQFLDDSEWDIESMDKVSHYSRGSAGSHQNELKLKQMEKLYLKRLEAQGANAGQKSRDPQQVMGRLSNEGWIDDPRKKTKLGPERETIINFTDDPGVIHRGEVLPFHTKNPNKIKTKK